MSDGGLIRVAVRTVAAHGEYPRYRAGLGPFRRQAVELTVTPEQLAQLEADPALAVARLGGQPSRWPSWQRIRRQIGQLLGGQPGQEAAPLTGNARQGRKKARQGDKSA